MCTHIHSLSSDWERRPCPLKYFDFVSVCVFVCLSTVISSIFGKSSHFPFSYFVLFILWYFPFHIFFIYVYVCVYIHTQIKGKESENSYQKLKRSLEDRHGRLFQSESEWKRLLCLLKYLDTVSVCLCVPVLRWSLQFLVRVFTFLSLNLCIYIYIYIHTHIHKQIYDSWNPKM